LKLAPVPAAFAWSAAGAEVDIKVRRIAVNKVVMRFMRELNPKPGSEESRHY
jgi:hypothetical protein